MVGNPFVVLECYHHQLGLDRGDERLRMVTNLVAAVAARK